MPSRRRYIYKKIGELLLERNLITKEQLDIALKEKKLKGGYLSQHLIRLGFVKDVDITMCLSSQLGFPYLPLENYSIPQEVLSSIPTKYALVYCLLPIERMKGLLTIAMVDPLNEGVINILRQHSNCHINVFISTYREIKESIEKYYHASLTDFDLDKFKDDDRLRENLKKKIVKSKLYSGRERRRYRRLNMEMEIGYFLYPKNVITKIKNISISGLLFESNTPFPEGVQLGVTIHLREDKDILAAVEILRTQPKVAEAINSNDDACKYYVAGFFNFISKEDHEILADFLRERLSKKNSHSGRHSICKEQVKI